MMTNKTKVSIRELNKKINLWKNTKDKDLSIKLYVG